MFWGAVGYNFHSPLVAVRRRDPSERTSDKDRLGLNSKQYCDEILHPYLLLLLSADSEIIEGGAPSHTSKETRLYATWDLQNSLASKLT